MSTDPDPQNTPLVGFQNVTYSIYVIYVVIFDRFSSILVQKLISMITYSQCIVPLSILFLFISLCSLFIRDFSTALPIRQVCVFCILY